MIDRRTPGRVLLGAGILLGVGLAAYYALPGTFVGNRPLGRDFQVYVRAAEAALAGEPFVGRHFAVGGRRPAWVYPPATVLAFVPYTVLPRPVAFGLHTLLNAAAALGTATLIGRTVARRTGGLARLDRALVAGFCLASPYAVIAIGVGQIDPLIMAALAAGYDALDRGRDALAGVLFALPAAVKLTPALVGLWLVYRRAWRALGVAVGLGLGSIALGVGVFGLDTSLRYVGALLGGRSQLGLLAGGAATGPGTNLYFSVTLTKPLAALFPRLGAAWYPVLAALLLAPVVGAVYRRAGRRHGGHARPATFLVTLLAMLLVSPATTFTHLLYLYFPALVLARTLPPGTARRAVWSGLALLLLPVQPWVVVRAADAAGFDAVYGGVAGVVETLLMAGSVPLVGLVVLVLGSVLAAGRDESSPDER